MDTARMMDSAMETVLAEPDPDMQHPNVQENNVPDNIEVLIDVWTKESIWVIRCSKHSIHDLGKFYKNCLWFALTWPMTDQ